jgi:NAD-dependent deacetylase
MYFDFRRNDVLFYVYSAGLLKNASFHAEKILVSLDIDKKPYGYKFVRAKATKVVPLIVERWLKGERAV